MKTFLRTVVTGGFFIGAGLLTISTGGAAAPLIGMSLIGSGSYTVAKGSLRGARELVEEEGGDCYYVYYDVDDKFLAFLNIITPEYPELDLVAYSLNSKIAHCKAWFTLSNNRYVTFEITAD